MAEKYENALITGATSGIGRGLAAWFARRGTRVYACGRREAELKALRSQLHDAEIELSSVLAQRSISLRDLCKLRVGDVIPLEIPRNATLKVEQMPLFSGEFGTHNGRNAIKVATVHAVRNAPAFDAAALKHSLSPNAPVEG